MADGKQATTAKLRRVLRDCARLLAECDELLRELTQAEQAASAAPRRAPSTDGRTRKKPRR